MKQDSGPRHRAVASHTAAVNDNQNLGYMPDLDSVLVLDLLGIDVLDRTSNRLDITRSIAD